MVAKNAPTTSDKTESLLQQFEIHFEYNQHLSDAKKQLHARTQK